MRISDWSSDVCSSDLLCRWVRADLPYRCSSRGILPRQMILIHALTYLQIPRFFVINRRDDRGGRRRHAAPAGRAILLFDMISAKAWSADVACDGYGAGKSVPFVPF